ncbi:hypothetical protein [Histidinibacterium aquaticum]|uniref:Pentapeptide repeat-containing protein n=1 Tax=Histidinibacterium aquaticum TaxID=2613962 RepID=A0A5J5GEZ6_9RHOB|nr:hypothetical protein [Histidinibacterium aquaticum]KAA9006044.1 hypothetical protein F3S47_15950 [Histidinibacterium aquaticum]
MDAPELTEDCGRCAALCCMAFAFDKGDGMAIDKSADTACPHLATSGLCSIHPDRDRLGFSGCVAYACNGAGQYVTQEIFGGASWLDDPSLTAPMASVFRDLARIQEWRAMLLAARAWSLPSEARDKLDRLEAELCPPPGEAWTAGLLAERLAGPLPREIRSFLKSLGPYVPQPS